MLIVDVFYGLLLLTTISYSYIFGDYQLPMSYSPIKKEESLKPHTRKTLITVIVVCVGVLIALMMLFGKPSPKPAQLPDTRAPLVDILTITPTNGALIVRTQGTVQARRQIDVVAQASGIITDVSEKFASGGFFEKGEEFIKIEEDNYRFALARAEAKVADAQQLLATEKGRVRQAKREWRELGSKEANDLFLRKPQLLSAQAALKSAEADRDQAKLDLERTAIKAPFNGRILQTHVDIGAAVNAGNQVAKFYSTDVVEVRLPLTDRQVALLDLPLNYQDAEQQDTEINVLLNGVFAGSDWQWPAVITRTEASIDLESRVVYAVAEINKPFERKLESDRPPLNIGQYVQAEIKGKTFRHLITLPRLALQDKSTLWLVDSDNKLKSLPVNVLQATADFIVVQGDFLNQVKVAVSSILIAADGMTVTPRDTSLKDAGLVESSDE